MASWNMLICPVIRGRDLRAEAMDEAAGTAAGPAGAERSDGEGGGDVRASNSSSGGSCPTGGTTRKSVMVAVCPRGFTDDPADIREAATSLFTAEIT
jgi:hypothetical protein